MNDMYQDLPRIAKPETQPSRVVYETPFTEYWINVLWVIGSWLVIICNFVFLIITIKEALVSYSPTMHWFVVSNFVASLGAISFIQAKIIKK